MNKKRVLAIVALVVVCIFAFALTACNSDTKIKDISVKTGSIPTTFMIGDTLDLTGVVLTVTFEDEAIPAIDVALSNDMVSGFDTQTAGEKELTIKYMTYEYKVKYTVVDPAVGNQAKIGNTYYETPAAALAAATADTTVTVYAADAKIDADTTLAAGVTLNVTGNLTVDAGKTLTNNGTIAIAEGGTLNVNGVLANAATITNAGALNVAVADLAAFNSAVVLPKVSVKLTANIDTSSYADIDIKSDAQAINAVIDLNGFKINAELNLRAIDPTTGVSFGNAFAITIKDTSATHTGAVGVNNPSVYYGIMVRGDAAQTVTLQNVMSVGYYGGLYTNGTDSGATVIATGCTFDGKNTADSVGAYLAANYTYNFTDCSFTGGSGIYAKSGTHTYTGCNVTAVAAYVEPNYNGNGAESTGDAFAIDSAIGYARTLDVTIVGGSYTSANGYAIHEFSTYPASGTPVSYADVSIDNTAVLTSTAKITKMVSVNDVVTIAE